MLIEGLLTLISWLLGLLLTPIHIPELPENVHAAIIWAVSKFVDGLSIFAAFTHFSFIMTLFGIVVIIDAAFLVYKVVLWILKKIPMASIE